MYSTCLFCRSGLGSNEAVEAFPVGRRLAFDAAKGRLWVVCRRCEKWNLSPFDERWEAVEECERRFRGARKRVSTDQIGLARLDEGLELVRIGEPLRPEFAAWRYGDQFGRRRRRAIAWGVGLGVLGTAAVVGGLGTGVLAGGGWWIVEALAHAARGARATRRMAHVPTGGGESIAIRAADLRWIRLLPGDDPEDLRLMLWTSTGETVITGPRAVAATALIIPKVNRAGASRKRVQTAVKLIEEHDDPLRYLHEAAEQAQRRLDDLAKWSPDSARRWAASMANLPVESRLAIEMAVNEESERAAMAGELVLLEMAWQQAEEIAAIADDLVVPPDVEQKLADLRRRRDR